MRYFIFILTILQFTSLIACGQNIRSYMHNEIIGPSFQGPISEVPQHSGTWVECDASGNKITMMDGSQWEQTNSSDGLIHYRYAGTSGQLQQYTRLQEAIFNKDFSKMKIRYAYARPNGGNLCLSWRW